MPVLHKVVAQTCPPLGQVTTLDGHAVALSAVLEVPPSTSKAGWQVAIWHSIDGAEWCQTDLSPDNSERSSQDLSPDCESTANIYFTTATIPFTQSLQFTLKYRLDPAEPWRWIRDEQYLDDGHIISLPPPTVQSDLLQLIPGLNPVWKASNRISQSPGTQLWSLTTAISPANGTKPTFRDITIGSARPFLRWFALIRASVAWLAPRQGKSELFLDKDAVLLSFLGKEGQSLVFLAVCDSNVLPVFRHTDGRGISVHAQNDSTSEEKVTILVSTGNSFENALASVMYEARNIVSKSQAVDHGLFEGLGAASNALQPEWEGSWYDGLGYCTWNSLGQKLTEQRVMDALEALKQHGVRITNLIIDDNWQSIDYHGVDNFQYGLVDFDAEQTSFPSGLKGTISKLKNSYPSIHNVVVWHSIIGYWGGISPKGELAKSYRTTTVVREEKDNRRSALTGKVDVVVKEDVRHFFEDFYQFLAKAGVDGVKADTQSILDMLQDASDRRQLIIEYLDAWNVASLRYFNFKTISCMSQIPQTLFHTLLPRSTRPFQVRNSDDYYPDIPSSHPWHVWANAHNAIFTQYLNAVPDWDMFQTARDHSGFHAAARCVSGGPIYITDAPGQHNLDLILQMTAKTVKGHTSTLRPQIGGKALHSYVGFSDNLLLKVGAYHGGWGTGTSMVALFNVSQQPLRELIPLSMFPGTVSDQEYVIRAHTTGKVSAPIKFGTPGAMVTTRIGVQGYEVLSGFPIVSFESRKLGRISISNLGLVGKMTGGVAIVSTEVEQRANHCISITTELKALGVLGIFISTLPALTIKGDFMVCLNDRTVPESAIRFSKQDNHVLEVHVEQAWKNMGLEPTQDNKFEVKIVFGS